MTWPRVGGLRAFDLGRPGEMRRRLTALVLDGTKTATAGLWQYDYLDHDEAIEEVGERQVLLGDDGDPAALIEVTRVESHRFVDVPWSLADAEGEGFTSIEYWQSGHRGYYEAEGIAVDDDTIVVCVWFRVLDERPGPTAPGAPGHG